MNWKKKYFGEPIFDDEITFVSERAIIIGNVQIEGHVYIAPNVSIRADEGSPFRICEGTNVQDGVLIHGLIDRHVMVSMPENHGLPHTANEKFSVYIGKNCAIAHHAIVHGPSFIGDNVFVGFRATVHNSEVGNNCFIGHHALVSGVKIPCDKKVPDGMILNSQELVDMLPDTTQADHDFCSEVVEFNRGIVPKYIERRKERNSELSTPLREIRML